MSETKEAQSARMRAYYQANREKLLARRTAARAAAPEQHREYRVRFNRKLREEFIAAYGGCCACCGEAEYEFLVMDHENGGGNQERAQYSNNSQMIIIRLKREGWPKDQGYRILCANCNMATMRGRTCPHQAMAAVA